MGVPGMLRINNLIVHVSASAGSGILSKAGLRVNSVYGNFQLRASGVFFESKPFLYDAGTFRPPLRCRNTMANCKQLAARRRNGTL